jgi:hypothetical protein
VDAGLGERRDGGEACSLPSARWKKRFAFLSLRNLVATGNWTDKTMMHEFVSSLFSALRHGHAWWQLHKIMRQETCCTPPGAALGTRGFALIANFPDSVAYYSHDYLDTLASGAPAALLFRLVSSRVKFLFGPGGIYSLLLLD